MKTFVRQNTVKLRSNYINLYGKFFECSQTPNSMHAQCLFCSSQLKHLIAPSFMLCVTPLGALLGFSDTLEHILLMDAQNKLS